MYNTILMSINKEKVTDKEFNEYALMLFQFQYETNKLYNKYCKQLSVDPNSIRTWEEIPFIPGRFFKTMNFTSLDINAVDVFFTSGTSLGEKGKIYKNYDDIELMNLVALKASEKYLPFLAKRNKTIVAYSYYRKDVMQIVEHVLNYYNIKASYFDLSNLELKILLDELKQAEIRREPINFFAFNSAILDKIFETKVKFYLSDESTIIDSGKPPRSKNEYIKLCLETFDIPVYCYINSYGLTEITSIFFDNSYFSYFKNTNPKRYKPNLPWTKTIAVSPKTLKRLPKGKIGLLRHYDLVNITVPLSIQTDDLGYEIEDGFEVIGKMKNAEAKTCTLISKRLINNQSYKLTLTKILENEIART